MQLSNQEIKLAAALLYMASEQFSNHGCNDLPKGILSLVEDEQELCDNIRAWNGGDEWPKTIGHVGDSSLMHYLSERLEAVAEHQSNY